MTDHAPNLAQRVAEEMRERLLKPMRPGGRMAPVRELARELGVCVKTVRAAQKHLAQAGLLETRTGSGVYLARQKPLRWIGLYSAVDLFHARTSSFHVAVVETLRRFLREQGLRTEIYIGELQAGEWEETPSRQRFTEDAEAGRLEGIVFLSVPMSASWREWVAGLRIPAVGANTPFTVGHSYDAMAREAVRRLYAQGCRRLAMLAWPHVEAGQPFREALAELGLDYRPEWVRSDLHPLFSGAGWEELREIWLARREKPDGLLVTDDVLFDDVRIAISELGIRVPEQLRIVAHANKGSRRQYPFPVTLAQFDPERYAKILGGMLLRQMKGEPVDPPIVTMPFEMVEAEGGGKVEGGRLKVEGAKTTLSRALSKW